GYRRERPVGARERRVLRPVADAEGGQQAERHERRPSGSERAAELLEACADACLGRPERQAELRRDLLVREVVEEGEAEGLALGRRELVERGLEDGTTMLLPRPLGRPRVARGEARQQ